MTFQTLASIDLAACTKSQLKNFVKLARDDWGRAIDLRSSSLQDLIEYLTMYLAHKAGSEEAAAEGDVAYTLSDFEGITDAPLGEWFASCPLTCDICNLPEEEEDFGIAICNRCEKRCELAEPEPAELEVPENFNAITCSSIGIILYHSHVHGNRIDKDWLCGILRDCRARSICPELVKEPLILKDHIFLGLAGYPANALDTLKAVIRRPEEFADMPPEVKESKAFYDNIGGLIGSDALSEMFLYHTIRDNLNYLQVRLGISSLMPRHYAIRDRLFATQDYDSQLVLLPSDRAALESETTRICEYFQLLTPDYEVFRLYDDETEKPLSESFDPARMASIADYGFLHAESFDLARMASIADYASIYAESFDWEPHSGGGYVGTPCDRLDPDRIELCLSFWNGSDYGSFLRLTAYHPDKARRPWLG